MGVVESLTLAVICCLCFMRRYSPKRDIYGVFDARELSIRLARPMQPGMIVSRHPCSASQSLLFFSHRYCIPCAPVPSAQEYETLGVPIPPKSLGLSLVFFPQHGVGLVCCACYAAYNDENSFAVGSPSTHSSLRLRLPLLSHSKLEPTGRLTIQIDVAELMKRAKHVTLPAW